MIMILDMYVYDRWSPFTRKFPLEIEEEEKGDQLAAAAAAAKCFV